MLFTRTTHRGYQSVRLVSDASRGPTVTTHMRSVSAGGLLQVCDGMAHDEAINHMIHSLRHMRSRLQEHQLRKLGKN